MVKALILPLISPLAAGYAQLYKEQKHFATLKECGREEFFGLRDFYRFDILEGFFKIDSFTRFFNDEYTWKLCALGDLRLLSLYASLIKMVYAIAAKSQQRPRWHELEHAIRRNFGGLIEGDPVETFKRYYTEKDVS